MIRANHCVSWRLQRVQTKVLQRGAGQEHNLRETGTVMLVHLLPSYHKAEAEHCRVISNA